MLKNIFRSRRRSKNGPFDDENEPADHVGSLSSKMFFPNIASGAHDEECVSSSHLGRDQLPPLQLRHVENVMSATDVRYRHADTEYINRVASSSQVAGHGGKYNSGRRVGKRHRLSSVVNKILMTRGDSSPAPRTMRMVASDLYTPQILSTKQQSYKNNGIPPSGACEYTDDDSVFAVPSLCQSCVSTALPRDGRKMRFPSENSWMCSQCKMQSAKARDRHRSTVSSPAELCTPSVDALAADNSEQPCKPKSKQAIHGSNNGKVSSVEDVTVCDDTASRNDALSIPSPLHVCDLETKSFDGHDVVDDDNDVIPELVEISHSSVAAAAEHYNQHSSPIVQPTAENENGHVNESAMYILTDSFLDYSSTLYAPSTAVLDSSQSTVAGHTSSEVMVAYDSEVVLGAESSYISNDSLVVSPQFMADAGNMVPQPVTKDSCQTDEKAWCRKPLSDWSTDDVLQWVVSSGLVQFYDTFHSKLLCILFILVVSQLWIRSQKLK